MSFDRIFRLLIKEFLQVRRDRLARFRLIVPPIVQMLIFGYAATFEVYHVPTVILDRDHSFESRDLLAQFTGSNRFRVVGTVQRDSEVARAIDTEQAAVAIVIHPGFAESLRKGQPAPLQLVVDGTNSNTALLALGYLQQIVGRFSADYAADFYHRGLAGPRDELIRIDLEQRPWFNADLNGRWFFVPGVIGTLTLIIVVTLTTSAIVREREDGTLEQIMVSPIRRSEFILGKTAPFFIIGLAEVLLIAIVGMVWFDVPFVGNPLVLALGTCLFLFSLLGLGLLISTICKTQQQAFASDFLVLNPMFTLSGFAFPISSMPEPLQWLTYLDPLRYYLVVIRATFLKGVGLDILWPQMLSLAVLGSALLALSVLRFRKSLD